MNEGLQALTERERETLRLLLAGHDAKSIARAAGLSVHTINERLRDARKKLGVSSSREAARLVAELEQGDPNRLGDKQIGVAPVAIQLPNKRADRMRGTGHRINWFGGGMLIMSLLIAAAAIALALHGNDPAGRRAEVTPVALSTASPATDPAAEGAARDWIALLDQQKWGDSWRTAASMFKSQVQAPQWATIVQAVRQPIGPVGSRTFQDATRTASLPGAPAGDYEVLHFLTDFARKRGAVESVILVRETGQWKVAGYFIR